MVSLITFFIVDNIEEVLSRAEGDGSGRCVQLS
jgi:hypothetical protein